MKFNLGVLEKDRKKARSTDAPSLKLVDLALAASPCYKICGAGECALARAVLIYYATDEQLAEWLADRAAHGDDVPKQGGSR